MIREASQTVVTLVWANPFQAITCFLAVAVAASMITTMRVSGSGRLPVGPVTPVWMTLIFGILIAVLGLVIQSFEDFVWWDANIFFSTVSPHVSQWYAPPIWPSAGRLFPLAHQEFHFLAKISETMTFYRLSITVELACLLACCWALLRESPWKSIALWLTLVTAPPIAGSYLGLIYPERNMVLLFVAGLYATSAYLAGEKRIWGMAATVLFALLMLYKETSFILVGAVNLAVALGGWAGPFRIQLHERARALAIALSVPLLLWWTSYLILIVPQMSAVLYDGSNTASRFDALVAHLVQPWIYMLIAAGIGRWLLRRDKPFHPAFDALPIAGIGYSAALITLRFVIPYYSAPVTLCACLYAWWVFKSRPTIVLVFAALIIVWQAPRAWEETSARKQLVDAKSQAAAYFGSIEDKIIRLHTYGISSYEAGLFVGFVEAKYGRPIELYLHNVDWQQPAPCTPDISTICRPASLPLSGDFRIDFGALGNLTGWSTVFCSKPTPLFGGNYRGCISQVE